MASRWVCGECGGPRSRYARICRGCQRAPLADRFWRKVARGDGCWEWTGVRNRQGYGKIGRGDGGGETPYAHHVAWWLATGHWPTDDEQVLHVCDNPPCVRNDDEGFYEVGALQLPRRGHLFLGTNSINNDDKMAKGRIAACSGERHWRASLSTESVLAIRSLALAGDISQRDIARQFGINRGTVSKIATGKVRANG